MEESIKKERFSREKCVLGAAAANRVVGWMLRKIHMGKPGTAEKAIRQREAATDGPNPASPTPEEDNLARTTAGDSSSSLPDTGTSPASEAERRHPHLSLSA